MNEVIHIENVYKSFGEGEAKTDVLIDINATIHQGEFVSIMGPSGSGKSTLLYLIGGLDHPSRGKIKIKGADISRMNDEQMSQIRRKNIGFVFQFYNLVPNLSVKENVLLPVMLDGGRPEAFEADMKEILDVVGLSHKVNHLPSELSGGQQQRVAIARALINKPDIILADEPIGNLDSKTGTEIMELFRDINRDFNRTIVQVTHSEDSAQYGKRTIVVKDGVIHEDR